MAVLTHTEDMARANPRAIMVRAEIRSVDSYRNQFNHDMRRGPQPKYVDLDRTHLNTVIVPYKRGPELRAICNERRLQRDVKRRIKSDAGVAVIGLIGFGTEAQELFRALPPRRQLLAYRKVAQAIAKRAGTTLEGLVVHDDETAPHAHFVLAGYNQDGQPLSNTMKRGMLSDFQTIAAEEIARFESRIERGRRRSERLEAGASHAEVIHKSVRQLHSELPAEIAEATARAEYATLEAEAAEQRRAAAREAATSAEARRDAARLEAETSEARRDTAASRAGELQSEITRLQSLVEEAQKKAAKNQQLADKARSDLERHQAQAAKVQQIAKRLTTYEKRESDALAAVQKAEARLAEVERDMAEIAAGATSLVAEAAGGTLRTNVWGGIELQNMSPLRAHARELMPLAEALVTASKQAADLKVREREIEARERDLIHATSELLGREAAVEARERRAERLWESLTGFVTTIRHAIDWVGSNLGLRLPERLGEAMQEIDREIEARAEAEADGADPGFSM